MADSTLIARFVTQSDAAVVCPLGGEVATTLEFEPERRGDTVRSVLDITLTPSGCRFASRGLDFTVDGNPNVHDRSVITTVDGLEEISVEGKTTGTVDWELENRSGTCMIDMELNAIVDLSGSEPTGARTYKGMMCGMAIELMGEEIAVGR